MRFKIVRIKDNNKPHSKNKGLNFMTHKDRVRFTKQLLLVLYRKSNPSLLKLYHSFYGTNWFFDKEKYLVQSIKTRRDLGETNPEETILSCLDYLFRARNDLILKCIQFIRKMPEEDLVRLNLIPDPGYNPLPNKGAL
jgi:hypothetical protein